MNELFLINSMLQRHNEYKKVKYQNLNSKQTFWLKLFTNDCNESNYWAVLLYFKQNTMCSHKNVKKIQIYSNKTNSYLHNWKKAWMTICKNIPGTKGGYIISQTKKWIWE